MEIITTVREMRMYADRQRADGHTLALVPTMGYLHEGHLSLVQRAKAEADTVIVSIFVNPTQFGPYEDFAVYPRDFETDCRLLEETGGVDVVFAPEASELYPDGVEVQRVWVVCPELSKHLCGKYRPEHFRGVLTVVLKLIAVCKPHVGVFGLKDAQQYMLLRKLARDLLIDIRVIGAPTARESTGLARSSRNAYLTSDERSQANVLWKAVTAAAGMIENGENRPSTVLEEMRTVIARAPLAILQYAEVVTCDTLQPVQKLVPGTEVIVAVAVYFRNVRLIDNAFASVP